MMQGFLLAIRFFVAAIIYWDYYPFNQFSRLRISESVAGKDRRQHRCTLQGKRWEYMPVRIACSTKCTPPHP